jgi:glycerate dehydrogenase
MKVVVLDAGTLDFDSAAWGELSELCDLVLHDKTPNNPEVVRERIRGAYGVFTNKVVLSADLIAQAESLKFVGALATGYNAIDIAAAKAHGVTVSNVPSYATATTAQHAVALILELSNQVGLHDATVQAGDWKQSEHFSYWKQAPVELEGLTVGIVGFGRIGRRVGAIVDAMGARIMASARTERNTPDYEGFCWADTETIFKEADVVSLHCPQTPENTGFVNASLLSKMKPGAFLVNTARGGLINESDLREALLNGPLGGAGLDVLGAEPMVADSPLIGLENCVITPHIAWASEVARKRLLETSVDNLRQFIAGSPINVVSA